MTFKLTLMDRKGQRLNEGDKVKISDGKKFTFFSEVKYIPEKKKIEPFDTFSFHSIEKIDAIPCHAFGTEDEYGAKYWYTHTPDNDTEADQFSRYLISWRECEILIRRGCYTIELM